MVRKKESKNEVVSETEEIVSKYSIADLVSASKRFKTSSVIVLAALKSYGQEEYSIEEAQKVINEFKSKEVVS